MDEEVKEALRVYHHVLRVVGYSVSDVVKHLVDGLRSHPPVILLVHDPADLVHCDQLSALGPLSLRQELLPARSVVHVQVVIVDVGGEPNVAHRCEHLLLLRRGRCLVGALLHQATGGVLALRSAMPRLLQLLLFIVTDLQHRVVVLVDVTQRLLQELQLWKLAGCVRRTRLAGDVELAEGHSRRIQLLSHHRWSGRRGWMVELRRRCRGELLGFLASIICFVVLPSSIIGRCLILNLFKLILHYLGSVVYLFSVAVA